MVVDLPVDKFRNKLQSSHESNLMLSSFGWRSTVAINKNQEFYSRFL